MTKNKHSFKDLKSGRIDIAKTTTAIKLAHLIFFFLRLLCLELREYTRIIRAVV